MDGLITAVVVLAVLFGAGFVGYRIVRKKLESVSMTLFGTSSFKEGWNRQADVLAATPKSVSGMTRVFGPQIERDFPDFNLNQFKNKAENMLLSALQAIDADDISLLAEIPEEQKSLLMKLKEESEKVGLKTQHSKS